MLPTSFDLLANSIGSSRTASGRLGERHRVEHADHSARVPIAEEAPRLRDGGIGAAHELDVPGGVPRPAGAYVRLPVSRCGATLSWQSRSSTTRIDPDKIGTSCPKIAVRVFRKDQGQALVIPALSLSMTWLIVKLAGVCDGGNSTNDWAIWAT